ncbi:hypothetical protein [Chromobacterium sp. Panama]|uniref:hypothetical protein n=1 Tax=Chromobacterium sp. Panama TaxID=2161826 RepID=UPI0011B1D8C3|nr:hypothetical protein [Chromobacterium sp. Panama]
MNGWFDEILSASSKPSYCSPSSENKTQRKQKGGTAENRAQKGFQDVVPTVPSIPTQKQSPRNHDQTRFTTPTGWPFDLLERVDLICRLEGWDTASRAEWLDILRRQIERDDVPATELVSCLDTHLAQHHCKAPS